MPVTPDANPEHDGLRAPRGPLRELEPVPARRPHRWFTRALGLAVSLGLLGWSVSMALTPENRASLERLADAPPGYAALLVALVLVGVALNGLIFRVVLSHTRSLGSGYLIAVNAIATLVSYAPFKMSLLARAYIHRRRDAMRYRTMIAWFAATGGLSTVVLLPVTLTGALHPALDAAWTLGALGGPAVLLGCAVLVARRVRRLPRLHAVTLGSAEYATDPARVAAVAALRLVDLAGVAARFWIAASILGIDLTPADAVAASSVYLLAGLVSFTGNLGIREGAVTGLGFLPAIAASEQLALIALTVTAAEITGAVLAGIAGTAHIRPWSLGRAYGVAGDAGDSTSRSLERPFRSDDCD